MPDCQSVDVSIDVATGLRGHADGPIRSGMTTDAFLAVGLLCAATLDFAAMAVVEERDRRRQKRRRQARWAQRYCREGGLIRSLIGGVT